MSGREVGSRIGAVLGAKNGKVEFLGFGTYEGRAVPDADAVGIADIMREIGSENPKLRLDSGVVVWGCECWWGSQEEIERRLEAWRKDGWTIVDVDMRHVRERVRSAQGAT